ncbi:MAG: FKBP-type peptidyl-prolyl cis-trans isomerase [Bacteroidales bacterium]|nr:FKBP-type peptidyl-prolyl cis-trans isomerase [Bacteroidales bacterium]MCF8327781.1 FKBP-type peptidyl-prolyl cis-trans isomerase [Bacteroidales bacterium]
MIIEKDKVVSIDFELKLNDENGPVVEKTEDEKPLTFLFGHGNLLEKFEDELSGKTPGDEFAFGLTSDNAYGQRREDMVVDLPKNIFKNEQGEIMEDLLVKDNFIPMRDESGNVLQGKVVEVKDDVVNMDFNHPLAGKDIHFKGVVKDIRDASKEELEHGHVHDEHTDHGEEEEENK